MSVDYELNEYIKELWPKIWRLCFRFVGEREADDMTQETFLKFLKSRDKFRGDAKLSTYIYRIAINLCIDKKRKPYFLSYEEMNEIKQFSKKNTQHDVLISKKINTALNSLPEKRRTVFILRTLEGYSTRETANIMNISEGTVKAHLHKSLIDLRVDLGSLIKELKG